MVPAVERVAMVGNSGSGKTTVGRMLAAQLDAPFLELDSLYHQAGWEPLPTEEFRRRVGSFVAADRWVIDGNYGAVRELIWDRADTVVWFDLPRRTVMRQVTARTLRRAFSGVELWNGNRERLRTLVRLDPNESILRWAWTQHAKYHRRYTAAAVDPCYAHLTFIRIGSRADADRLIGR